MIGFFKEIVEVGALAFVASLTIGELRRGVELIRRRGDLHQAERLAGWLENVVDGFAERILPFGADAAQVWEGFESLIPITRSTSRSLPSPWSTT